FTPGLEYSTEKSVMPTRCSTLALGLSCGRSGPDCAAAGVTAARQLMTAKVNECARYLIPRDYSRSSEKIPGLAELLGSQHRIPREERARSRPRCASATSAHRVDARREIYALACIARGGARPAARKRAVGSNTSSAAGEVKSMSPCEELERAAWPRPGASGRLTAGRP